MKRPLLPCILITLALLLTGCGFMSEEPRSDGAAAAVPEDDAISETAVVEPYVGEITIDETRDEQRREEFPADLNAITDEQVIGRLYSPLPNSEYIKDYHDPEGYVGMLHPYIPKYDGDAKQEYIDESRVQPIETLGENEYYAICHCPQTSISPSIILKQFKLTGNGYAEYKGELTEDAILTNFDYLAQDKKLLCRWFRDDPEVKCLSYEFFAVELKDNNTAELGWYCYLIDRDDHQFSIKPEWNQTRTIDLTGADGEPSSVITDVELTLDKNEILIGQEDPEIVVRAVPAPECSPASVELRDTDTGELLCLLVDDCDYEAHGDDIKGDGWYCNRYRVPTDFGTDPDVSEDKTFRFYAQFVENDVLHRSESVELTVYEPWTDKELDDRQKVDDATKALMETDEWKQADIDTRRRLAVECLQKLADEGLVVPESICESEDMVSWSVPSGGISCIQLKPFDPRMN